MVSNLILTNSSAASCLPGPAPPPPSPPQLVGRFGGGKGGGGFVRAGQNGADLANVQLNQGRKRNQGREKLTAFGPRARGERAAVSVSHGRGEPLHVWRIRAPRLRHRLVPRRRAVRQHGHLHGAPARGAAAADARGAHRQGHNRRRAACVLGRHDATRRKPDTRPVPAAAVGALRACAGRYDRGRPGLAGDPRARRRRGGAARALRRGVRGGHGDRDARAAAAAPLL